MTIHRESVVDIGDTPVFPKDPKHRGLEGADEPTSRQSRTNEGSAAAMSTRAVTTKSSAGIELASVTESVTAAKAEVLGPQVEGEAMHVCGYCHEKESAGKSTRCVEGIQARAIWSSLEKAPLLDILMRISPCDLGGTGKQSISGNSRNEIAEGTPNMNTNKQIQYPNISRRNTECSKGGAQLCALFKVSQNPPDEILLSHAYLATSHQQLTFGVFMSFCRAFPRCFVKDLPLSVYLQSYVALSPVPKSWMPNGVYQARCTRVLHWESFPRCGISSYQSRLRP